MKLHTQLLVDASEIEALCRKLQESDIIALDTEFIRENSFFPSVEIIQVATDSEAWLIDAQAFRGQHRAGLKPFVEILRNPKILKILHAAQGDQECFYTFLGQTAIPSFDTAIGASLCGYGDGIGLGNLLKALLDVQLKKGHARTNWATRPLPKQLTEYAIADVEYLVQAAQKLLAQLDELGRRSWSLTLSAKYEDKKLYDSDPEELALKIAKGGRFDAKAYAALVELMRWREARVRELNLPRRWVADDQVLIDLAQVRPKDLEHLSTFRGLNKGEMKNHGAKILAAIRASEAHAEKPPSSPRPAAPSAEESQVMDLLKTYIGVIADEQKIATKNLLTVSQLLPLIRNRKETVKTWVEKDLLSPEAAEIAGGLIRELLNGQRALSVQGGHLKVIPIEPTS